MYPSVTYVLNIEAETVLPSDDFCNFYTVCAVNFLQKWKGNQSGLCFIELFVSERWNSIFLKWNESSYGNKHKAGFFLNFYSEFIQGLKYLLPDP